MIGELISTHFTSLGQDIIATLLMLPGTSPSGWFRIERELQRSALLLRVPNETNSHYVFVVVVDIIGAF